MTPALEPATERGTVPVTGIVVSCNEASLLEQCLSSLAFCEELIVVDMACTDGTAEVARRHGARICPHPRVSHVEMILEWAASLAGHDWVLNIDPDERVDESLAGQLTRILAVTDLSKIGALELPWQFYFGSHALRGTYWGGENYKRGAFFHRQRVVYSRQVHHRPVPREGFEPYRIAWAGTNVLHHYWMNGYRQFLEKHLRYLKAEGGRRHQAGETFSWARTVWDTCFAFVWSVVRRKSYRDGLLGFALSGLYAWYVGSSWLSLRRFETGRDSAQNAASSPQSPVS